MMLEAGVGILRTMPAADARDGGAVPPAGSRRWASSGPRTCPTASSSAALDRANPRHLALIHEATALFRGAGYTPFDGELPEQHEHAAVAARLRPRHGAAAPARRPLRPGRRARRCRRGAEVPGWAREALASLPEVMARSDRVAAAVDRASTDAVEVASLQHLVGQTFRAVVVDARKDGGLIQIAEPAILAPLTGAAPAGSEVTARLVEADLGRRVLRFELVSVDEPADPTEAAELTEPTEATERPEPTS